MSLFGGGSSFGQSNVFGNTATAANTNPMKDFEVRVLHWLQDSTGQDSTVQDSTGQDRTGQYRTIE